MWRSFMARAGPPRQDHDPGHAPGDALASGSGMRPMAGGQAAIGQVLRRGAPAAGFRLVGHRRSAAGRGLRIRTRAACGGRPGAPPVTPEC